ncbi:RHS repeat-associated core domain-containing protein [Pseudomonas mosselii]|uniref:RHS repeat-associated core domain-containing protein n=1 Tax=Pseudomonas mosselii TaxID=78327 RepID=UPI001EE2183C|nr:RHS repeat-associated core domain-containing protein [Pseudomonas mosselii]
MAVNHLAMCDRQQSIMVAAETPRSYTPYGGLSTALVSRLAYCGEPQDGFTGNYHLGNGHRTYNPCMGRFHSPDRLSPFEAGGINAYVYCSGDPINYQDRSGNQRNPAALLVQALGAGKTLFQIKHGEAAINMLSATFGDNPNNVAPPTMGEWLTLGGALLANVAASAFSLHAMAGYSPSGNSQGLIGGIDRVRGYYKPYEPRPPDVMKQDMLYDAALLAVVSISIAADARASISLQRFTDEWGADAYPAGDVAIIVSQLRGDIV